MHNGRDLPRPEFPRPDFRRDPWGNLNGEWDFTFDDYDLGEKGEWFERGKGEAFKLKITVPFPYQSRLSGIGDEDFHDVVWYRREFDLPESFAGRRVLLRFGAVDYEAKVWLNGGFLGVHRGGYAPFSFDVTGLIRPSGNILVLRAYDPHGDQPRGKQDSARYPRGCRYMRVTGIWQTVWLEAVGDPYVTSYRVIPDISSAKASISVEICGDASGCDLDVRISFASSEIAGTGGPLGDGRATVELPVPNMKLWSPDRPDLYTVDMKVIKGGAVQDHVRGYFGMREISIDGNKILLNGEPCYLRMALDQGYYPDGLYAAPTDAALRFDVEAAKRLGLNGVRKHQIAPDPRYLYWCDKLGLMVWGEMGDWGMTLPGKLEPFWEEWREIIVRDFNHPSIIAWTPFNERRDAHEDPSCQEVIVGIYRRTKELDPTRPVVDNSGYEHTETDIADIHDYTARGGGHTFSELWGEYHRSGGEPPSPHVPLMAKGFSYRGQPIVISEYGGWGVKGMGPIVDRPYMAYHTVEDEFEFISVYRDVTEAIMREPDVCGFCYTQLYDVEGEVNGYLTYDRRWKVNPDVIAEINGGK